jgi:eukaryotic-like serine/threonine-protein kinase
VPIEEALAIARQIVEALEAAHEKGICHRDLKPANVKLTPDGSAKVLDFGLAKFMQAGAVAGNLTHSPTLTVAGTLPGVILGTAACMSPEQAKGFEADQRSDIFAFGCIMYELLAGRQAFQGETASEILASVIKVEPDLTALPPRLNPRLVDLLRRCLEKNPKKRWHSAADVPVEIESLIGRGLIVEEPHPAAAAAVPLWKRAIPIAAAMALGGIVAEFGAWMLKPAPARTVTRFTIAPPAEHRFVNGPRSLLALSPDGANLAYSANRRLYLRSMSALEARAIAGSDLGVMVSTPVFSPDGQSIAFWSAVDRTLKRIPITGGAPLTLCPSDVAFGLSWDESGILFGQTGKGIMRVSTKGGSAETVAAVGADEMAASPQMLPNGRGILFSVKKTSDTWDKGQVVVHSVATGQRTTIVSGGGDSRYLPTGHLLYARSGVLFAVPFDIRRLAVTGEPVPIVEGIQRSGVNAFGTGVAQFAYATNGTLAYLPGPVVAAAPGGFDLAIFDRSGGSQALKLPLGSYRAPRVSPDGKFVAFESVDEAGEETISIYEIAGGTSMRRLTFGGKNRAPVWSPDGQWIAFQSDREGDLAIFRQRADGSGAAERLTKPDPEDEPHAAIMVSRRRPSAGDGREGSRVFAVHPDAERPAAGGVRRRAIDRTDRRRVFSRWSVGRVPISRPERSASVVCAAVSGHRREVPAPAGNGDGHHRTRPPVLESQGHRDHFQRVADRELRGHLHSKATGPVRASHGVSSRGAIRAESLDHPPLGGRDAGRRSCHWCCADHADAGNAAGASGDRDCVELARRAEAARSHALTSAREMR